MNPPQLNSASTRARPTASQSSAARGVTQQVNHMLAEFLGCACNHQFLPVHKRITLHRPPRRDHCLAHRQRLENLSAQAGAANDGSHKDGMPLQIGSQVRNEIGKTLQHLSGCKPAPPGAQIGR